jgi:hypothetical protein
MTFDWISLPALLAVQIGFAALLGAVLRNAHTVAQRVAALVAGLLFVVAGLVLPLGLAYKAGLWMFSAIAFAAFALRPFAFKWPRRFGWLYAGFAMLLILAWSAAQGSPLPLLLLGVAAGLAAALAWRRGWRVA